MPNVGEVRLVVPARPEYIGLARVTAAGLASRLGFTYDEVEDLRLAIDEICFGLTGSNGRDGTLEVRFSLAPEGLTVHGEGRFSSPNPLELPPFSQLILDALVDEHSLADAGVGPHFVLVKKLHSHTSQTPAGETRGSQSGGSQSGGSQSGGSQSRGAQ